MEITTTTCNKTFIPPTVKQSKLGQFFRKQARNIGLMTLGTITLLAVSNTSHAQTNPSKIPVDSTRKITSVIDSTGWVHIRASWTNGVGGSFQISDEIAGMADSKVVSEKDTIRKISIPGKFNAEGHVISNCEVFHIFPKGVFKTEINPLYSRILTHSASDVFNDTIFRNAIFFGKDTAGRSVVLVPSASEVFVSIEHKQPYMFYFLSSTRPVNPYWTEDADYAYLNSKAFGKNGDEMYRFSKTDPKDVVYMKRK